MRSFCTLSGRFIGKTKTHADPYRINVRLQDRSGETRTRGLLLPKQARYQLRNTPEKYYHSILFFAAFVNPEVRNFTLPLFVRIFIRKSGCKGRKG